MTTTQRYRYLMTCLGLFTLGGLVGPVLTGKPPGPLFWIGFTAFCVLVAVGIGRRGRGSNNPE